MRLAGQPSVLCNGHAVVKRPHKLWLIFLRLTAECIAPSPLGVSAKKSST
jgi:hypothetical protein